MIDSDVLTIIARGHFDEALQKIKDSDLEINEKYFLNARIERLKGNYDFALKYAFDGLNHAVKRNAIGIELRCYIELAYSYWRKSEFERVKELIDELHFKLKLIPENERIYFEAYSSHILALLQWSIGNLDDAIEINLNNVDKFKEMKFTKMHAVALNNLGVLLKLKGRFDESLKFLNESVVANNNFNMVDYSITLGNISDVYRDTGKFAEAITFLQKALKIQLKVNNPQDLSSTYFSLILLYLQIGKSNKIEDNIAKLAELNENGEDKLIDLRYRLVTAIKKKYSPRLKNKFSSLIELQKIIDEPIIRADYSILAMKILCELLIIEYSYIESSDVIGEINELLDRFETISIKQYSMTSLAEAYYIRSQMCTIKQDYSKAKLLLNDALRICENNKLDHLAIRISNALDETLVLEKYTEDSDDLSVIKTIERTQLMNYFENYLISPHKEIKVDAEIPILFLILTENGLVKFSYRFVEDDLVNENLFGSFISAINSFTSSTFNTEDSLDRISNGEYTILIKMINQLMYVYIVKGYSYHGLKKLDLFANHLSKDIRISNISEVQRMTKSELKSIEDKFIDLLASIS